MAAEALQACRPKLLELRRRALLSPVGTLTNDTILFVVVERLHGHSTWAWLQPGAVPKCSSGGSGGGSDGAAALVVLRAHTSLSDRQPQCAAASMLLDVRAVARPPAHTAVAARAVTQLQVAQHLLARAVTKVALAPAGMNFVRRWALGRPRRSAGRRVGDDHMHRDVWRAIMHENTAASVLRYVQAAPAEFEAIGRRRVAVDERLQPR